MCVIQEGRCELCVCVMPKGEVSPVSEGDTMNVVSTVCVSAVIREVGTVRVCDGMSTVPCVCVCDA